jgi:hypothetical protein
MPSDRSANLSYSGPKEIEYYRPDRFDEDGLVSLTSLRSQQAVKSIYDL